MGDVWAERRERSRLLARCRGLLLGAALGDTTARTVAGHPPGQTGLVTQLCCVTTEGIIRSGVRGSHKGISSLSGSVQHAMSRWAYRRKLSPEMQHTRWSHGGNVWPDGWLADTPLSAAARDHSPAIERAARSAFELGQQSSGAHALSRVMPLALLSLWGDQPADVESVCRQTHDSDEAAAASLAAVTLLARLLADADASHECLRLLESLPGSADPLTAVGSLRSAASAVARGGADPVADCLAAGGSAVAAAMTGALVGAHGGVSALAQRELMALDAGWIVDTLARDLIAQQLDQPSGGEHSPLTPDDDWWHRYPGW